jgi:colanic acid biosynthesis glycosyl transferase WcaI
MLQRALTKTDGKTLCVLFPNGVDPNEIFPLERPSQYRAALGIPEDRVVLLYSGSMGEKQGLELILDAARELQADPRYQFVMAGSGSAYERLKKQAAHLANMRWLPLQPQEKLNSFLNLADIHLLPQREGAADLVMPSKLTGMLASGRPIIATARQGSQVATVIDKAGLVVEPGCLPCIVSALRRLCDDESMRRRLGSAARRYAVDVLERERILRGFEQQLTEMQAKQRHPPVAAAARE